MRATFRIADDLLGRIHEDLSRRHAFAHERVGFIRCQVATMEREIVVLAQAYDPVEDADYLRSKTVGAMMGPDAIRKALQIAYREGCAMFHVHRHEHKGTPGFSQVDMRENATFVPNFWHVAPKRPHGALVLSHDAAAGLIWKPGSKGPTAFADIFSIGRRITNLGGW